mmetsp:Transcript_21233/g.56747  ORF Transcript_21233/g.56747 Transcript_21233/m.56747 type:complete len:130 (-) Transcript_21233:1188-1577(-)
MNLRRSWIETFRKETGRFFTLEWFAAQFQKDPRFNVRKGRPFLRGENEEHLISVNQDKVDSAGYEKGCPTKKWTWILSQLLPTRRRKAKSIQLRQWISILRLFPVVLIRSKINQLRALSVLSSPRCQLR